MYRLLFIMFLALICCNRTRTAKIKLYPARRVVVSDSESDEDTTKQLGLGSRDRTTRNVNEPSNKEAQPKSQLGTRTTATRIDVEEVLESEDDDPGTPDEEGAILVLYTLCLGLDKCSTLIDFPVRTLLLHASRFLVLHVQMISTP